MADTASSNRTTKEPKSKVRPHLVLFPLPFQGHINPMLQLATVLHSKGFSITIVHTRFNSPNPSNYTQISFQSIEDGLTEDDTENMDVIAILSHVNINCEAPFRDFLGRMLMKEGERLACIVTDAMLHFTQGVAEEFKIKRIVLRTSSAASFGPFEAFPMLREKGYIPMQALQSEMPVVELPPLRVKDLPDITTANPGTFYQLLAQMVKTTRASSGVIWNSIDSLEHSALAKIQQVFQIPVFVVGPLHKYSSSSSSSLLTQDRSCIAWLDKQATGSVIYISFGSLAAMDTAELAETAWGIANSEIPFLWIRGRGQIVKWAPQEEVLAHPAVGGFWTHNGWNSTIESISEGVPMLCSPHFGDQRVNARYVSHVWKLGLQLENGLERDQIAKAIKRLMIGTEAKEMRERIKVVKENVDNCLKEGGSSYESLNRLTNYILS
ncbi:UDP-glycosyltransferase 76B1-like protein [Cinnamomum micranthum f. kanehirae]|uniref:UDP-glycosyltransferase 76B1-like protein n=1 Tax=Cinnamomum micranthum f. kanehirae TaxID=337451 RepID=A0A3S3QIX1_9MAGN|nr:UDP-glycosyltransferase 76B1-like protein [Cinnamomum micranthum f. kanehirae]